MELFKFCDMESSLVFEVRLKTSTGFMSEVHFLYKEMFLSNIFSAVFSV